MSDPTQSDPTQSSQGQTAPGWYPDPTNGQLRWWDGQQWGQFAEGAQGTQPVVAGTPVAGTGTVQNPQQMAMLAHLLGALLGFIGPIIILYTSGQQDPFVKDQATEATNFQLTILIGWVIAFVLAFVLIGFLLMPFLWLGQIIFGIIGAMAANKGEWYRYPFSIKMLKA